MIAAALPPAPPAIVAAAPAFRPPRDRPVLFRLVDQQQAGSTSQRFATQLSLRFEPNGAAGYRLTLVTVPEPGGGNPIFRQMMTAFAAIPLHYELDGRGVPVEVINADASWDAAAAAIASGVARATQRAPASPAAGALRGFRDAFAATPAAVRRATLLANAQAILGLATPDLAVGATRNWSSAAADAGGRPVTLAGTLTRLADEGALIHFRIDGTSAAKAEAGAVEETIDLLISSEDGLLRSSQRTLRAGPTAPPFFSETVTRIP